MEVLGGYVGVSPHLFYIYELTLLEGLVDTTRLNVDTIITYLWDTTI